MATIQIKISKATAHPNGWYDYSITATQTNYKDKDIYKNYKMSWNPDNKSWSLSGSAKAEPTQIITWLTRSVAGAIPLQYKLEVIQCN